MLILAGQVDDMIWMRQRADSAYEVAQMPNAELHAIPSLHGHLVAGDKDPSDTKFINETLKESLAN